MSIRLILRGKVKDGQTNEDFSGMAQRAAAFSEADDAVTLHNFYLTDDGQYWEEEVFTDDAGFLTHLGAATEAGIIDDYLARVDVESVLVLDPVNADTKAALDQWGAVYSAMVGGF